MDIRGFVPFTVIDYPGKLACIVFCGGCNMRCSFCHNSHLVLHPGSQPRHEESEVLGLLSKRIGKLEGMVVSGGEPCLQNDLPAFLSEAKKTGIAIKLDTNGTKPDLVESLLSAGLVDMLAVDVKNSPEKYAGTTSTERNWWPEVSQTLRTAVAAGVSLEARTTVHRRFHDEESLCRIRQELDDLGIEEWVIQRFVALGIVDSTLNEESSWTRKELAELAGRLDRTRLRAN